MRVGDVAAHAEDASELDRGRFARARETDAPHARCHLRDLRSEDGPTRAQAPPLDFQHGILGLGQMLEATPLRRSPSRRHKAVNGAGHGLLLLIRPWPTCHRQGKDTALLQVHRGKILQPKVEGIGLSGKDRVYRPTRGKLRLHIGADILKVAGGVIYTACGGTPAGNLGSNHDKR